MTLLTEGESSRVDMLLGWQVSKDEVHMTSYLSEYHIKKKAKSNFIRYNSSYGVHAFRAPYDET